MRIEIDLTNDQPLQSRDPLPADWYPVIIIGTEQKSTKANDGHYINVEMEVIEGPHKGRRVWDMLNLWNRSEKAVEIARRGLRSITDAVKLAPRITDTEQLHNRPLLVRVGVRQDPGYEAQNIVREYKAFDGAYTSAPQAPAAAPIAAPPAPATSKPAWVK